MAESSCIVCLGDLRAAEDPPPEAPADAAALHGDATNHTGHEAKATIATSVQPDDETIAHLLPCKHDLHNACLKPWVERANSCPICRTKFNMVELSHFVDGPVFDSYAVRDKVQEAELDPSMIMEDELIAIEAWEPCLICGEVDDVSDPHDVMYCDGCDELVHVFCAGFGESPEVWYCERCTLSLENGGHIFGRAFSPRRRAARRAAGTTTQRRRGNRNPNADWARVWQEVSRRLDLDLDFPFDDEPRDTRTPAERREFATWQRRFAEASRQGASNRLRAIASTQIGPAAPAPNPESQDEIKAWNAFEKARESQDAPAAIRRRKREPTDSPASPSEAEPAEQPQLKRPRLRRPANHSESHPVAESSAAAAQRAGEEPTFLSSLLREVKTLPPSAHSPNSPEMHNGQHSPRDMSSPLLSPSSSACVTPRMLSPQRPISPPLSNSGPASPHDATFSPFSPVALSQITSPDRLKTRRRGRQRPHLDDPSSGDERCPQDRASSMSPSRLSYSAKEELQRMVKLALGAHYRNKEISKDQYTDINRDVSRKLYDLVGDVSALADQAEREKWQSVAVDEVEKAISLLSARSPASE